MKPGDTVTLDYYLWKEEGRLESATATFRLAAIVPLQGEAADPDLVPDYPGITETLHLADWDPPFPVDLKRIRPKDEEYWDRHRTTPKAFVPLAVGQKLWGHRLGRVTSIRLVPAQGYGPSETAKQYTQALVPALLAGDTEQRLAGLLARRHAGPATGPGRLERHHRLRGVLRLLQLLPGGGRAAPGRPLLPPRRRAAVEGGGPPAGPRLHPQAPAQPAPGRRPGPRRSRSRTRRPGRGRLRGPDDARPPDDLARRRRHARAGARHIVARARWPAQLGGIAAATIAIAWTLRDLRKRSPRALLAGSLDDWTPAKRRGWAHPHHADGSRSRDNPASAAGAIGSTPGFFGGGALLLIAALAAISKS